MATFIQLLLALHFVSGPSKLTTDFGILKNDSYSPSCSDLDSAYPNSHPKSHPRLGQTAAVQERAFQSYYRTVGIGGRNLEGTTPGFFLKHLR